jgi:predicted transcriptional regulator YheO
VILFGEYLEQQNFGGTGVSDFGDIVRATIDNVIHASSKVGRNMNRKERLEAIRRLDELGVFVVKNSKELVAAQLGISKAALYKYLRTIRESGELSSGDVA